MEKQNITIKIAGESYPQSVPPALEFKLRAAVDAINTDIRTTQEDYPDVPLYRILSIVLLNEELKLVEALERNEGEYGKLLSEVKDLDAGLGAYLSR